jgi:ComF family protein
MHPPVLPALLSVPPQAGRAGLATQCELCRQWTQGDALCADCEACYAQPRLRCACCALPTGTAVARCGVCLATPELPYTCTVAAVDYAFPWDSLVTAFKFGGRVDLAEALARRMAGAVAASSPHDANWVLPVPLSPARLAERGYNQAWELARRVARLRGLPSDATLLQRPIDTAHQTGLDRAARAANLAGSFMVDPTRRAELTGRAVALVDDVMTTGATVAAAAAVLRRAGAASVSVWVFARTPAPGRD